MHSRSIQHAPRSQSRCLACDAPVPLLDCTGQLLVRSASEVRPSSQCPATPNRSGRSLGGGSLERIRMSPCCLLVAGAPLRCLAALVSSLLTDESGAAREQDHFRLVGARRRRRGRRRGRHRRGGRRGERGEGTRRTTTRALLLNSAPSERAGCLTCTDCFLTMD
jgi:hypothetical protein